MTEHNRGLGALTAGTTTAALGGLALGWIQMRRRATVEERVRLAVRRIDPQLAQGVAHLGSAIVLGTGFGALAGGLANRSLRVAAGALFGAALGGATDAGLMPAFRLTHQPELLVQPVRRWGMIALHALAGAVLGALLPDGPKPSARAAPSTEKKSQRKAENIILAGGTIIEPQEPAHA